MLRMPSVRSTWYPGYVLLLLAMANVLNAVDRNLVGLLAELIKQDLKISDTSLGLLSGFAFAVFFVLFGIPIARWADRGNRRTILALGIGLWSVMTALFGLGTGFAMLLLARIGVGIGEAAAVPTAMSLIADYFRRERRTRAVSIFQSAVFLGLTTTAIAGFVAQQSGWRAAFVGAGAVGLALALVVRFTLTEPVRGGFDPASDRNQAQPPLRESIRVLLGQPLYLLILAAMASSAMSSTSLSAWGAAFLIRIHGLNVSEVAAVVGPASGIGGFLGSLAGGFLTVYVVNRTGDRRWTMLIPAIALFLAVPTVLVFLFTHSAPLAVGAFGFQAFLWAIKTGPCFAVALDLVPSHLRAFAVSVLIVMSGVVGNGLGPLLVGFLSDALGASFAGQSIRYALILAPAFLLVAAVALLIAARSLATSAPRAGLNSAEGRTTV
ncbi:MAG: MFS transporter [Gammaproteobacteria bacterium]